MTRRPAAPGGRYGELDGLRAFAVAGTMVAHSGLTYFTSAGYGVDVFFVLSGFLITHLLLGDWARTGRVSILPFYRRRAYRLLPALFTLLLVVDALTGLFAGPPLRAANSAATIHALTYSVNWMTGWAGSFSALWTLSIEEQFYLVWPPILVLVLWSGIRWTVAGAVIAGLAVVDLLYMAIATHEGWFSLSRVVDGTDTHCHGILLGVALAFLLTLDDGSVRRLPATATRCAAGGAGVALIVIFCCHTGRSWHLEYGYALVVVAAATLVAWVVSGSVGRFGRFLRAPALVYLGRLSYSLYLWHLPIYYALDSSPWWRGHPFASWPAKVVFPLAAAAVSYHWVEQPALRRAARRPAPALVAVTG